MASIWGGRKEGRTGDKAGEVLGTADNFCFLSVHPPLDSFRVILVELSSSPFRTRHPPGPSHWPKSGHMTQLKPNRVCAMLSCSVMSDSLRPHGLELARHLCPWGFSPGKKTGMGCHALLQGIFLTQGSNPSLLQCRQILYQLSHQGSPKILEWGACPISSGSSHPRNRTRISCIAGDSP